MILNCFDRTLIMPAKIDFFEHVFEQSSNILKATVLIFKFLFCNQHARSQNQTEKTKKTYMILKNFDRTLLMPAKINPL